MIRLGLDSIKKLCDKLNNPQENLKFLHIAGTNGKGSTGAFIRAILTALGYKTGHFSSPAVMKDEEIISINNRNITKKLLNEYMERVEEASKELVLLGNEEPTEFEKQTAVAFLYFYENDCDYVVLECGMGGESDATNIVNNTVAAVFTPISMDHMDYLGDTLLKIATVKSGIIKKNCIVVSAKQEDEVIEVLRNKALSNESRFFESTQKVKEISLLGNNQKYNAGLAMDVVRSIIPEADFNSKKVVKAINSVKMPGRFEKICDKPTIVLDGGHNIGAALCVKENIEKYYSKKKIILITGMLVNKEHEKVMSIVAPLCDTVLTISTKGDRGYSAENLAKDILPYNSNVSAIGGIEEALDIGYMMAKTKDVILVFGSLSFLKEVNKWKDIKKL